jgi:adenylate cyclase
MEADPSHLGAEGKRVEATMMFTDITGFSRIAEELDPKQLQELLNVYLSPMTQIIMERKGYVDKYEGDLIMAVWGVPYATPDHAVEACRAAVEQLKKLDELKADLLVRFGHSIKIRIGINTGRVVAGNMGPAQRFQYTVVGDAVNIASRLETLNKNYGSRIIIGEPTYEQAKDAIDVRLLDCAEIPGTSHKATFYELLGMKGTITDAQRETIQLYEEALQMHWKGMNSKALKLLDSLLEIEPRDMAATRLRRTIRDIMTSPERMGL